MNNTRVILTFVLALVLAIGGYIFVDVQAANNERQDRQIELIQGNVNGLHEQKADYDVIQQMLKQQHKVNEKYFDQIREQNKELQDLRERQIRLEERGR